MTTTLTTDALYSMYERQREEFELRDCSECGESYYAPLGFGEITCEDHPT